MATTATPALSLACALALAAGPVEGAGELDTDFAAGAGYVLVPFGGTDSNDQSRAVLVDSEQRILAAGVHGDGSTHDPMGLVRLLPDGSLDPDFGTGGRRSIAFNLGGSTDTALSVEETAAGGYVVCGTGETTEGVGGAGDLVVARVLENGAFDPTLDFDGRRNLRIPHPSGDAINIGGHCALMPDGRIVLVATVADEALTDVLAGVARLMPDGSLDTTFNGTGYRTFHAAPGEGAFTIGAALTLHADGRVVVAGRANTGTDAAPNFDIHATRLLADGSLDPEFGVGGTRLVAFDQGGNNTDVATAIEATADGGYVIAGEAEASTGTDIALVRLDADGDFVPGFGTSGRALVGYDGGGTLEDGARGVGVDRAGRILVTGHVAVAEDNTDLAVLRVTDTGAPDPGFGNAGWHLFAIDSAPFMNEEAGHGLAFDARQRPVIAGLAHAGSAGLNYDFLVLRLTSEHLFADGFEAIP